MRALAMIAATLIAAGSIAAGAAMQESAAELRATGQVGEQYDGYLGLVGSAPPRVRAEMDAVNIRRRSHYTELAARRRARVEEVGVAAACEILATRVGPGQYYRLSDGAWHRREGSEPVPRPDYCE